METGTVEGAREPQQTSNLDGGETVKVYSRMRGCFPQPVGNVTEAAGC